MQCLKVNSSAATLANNYFKGGDEDKAKRISIALIYNELRRNLFRRIILGMTEGNCKH
jgi:hypothetical protein